MPNNFTTQLSGPFITIVFALSASVLTESAQREIFSGAEAYERFMGRWSREAAPILVKFAGVRDGDAVLDVGSGTGSLTSAVAKAAPSARVVGIDPAESYVAFARAHLPGERIRFEVGDAQGLRFDDQSFDRT